MFITLSKGDNLNRIVNQFICENEEDLQEIPKNERIFGSMAYIVSIAVNFQPFRHFVKQP